MTRANFHYLPVLFVLFVLFSAAGCSRKPAVLTLVSDLHTPSVCGVLPSDPDISLEQFRFYLSGLQANIDGQWMPVPFMPSETQTAEAALVDLLPRCHTGEQTQVNLPLALSHHKYADVSALRFDIGAISSRQSSLRLTLSYGQPNQLWQIDIRPDQQPMTFEVVKSSTEGVILVPVHSWIQGFDIINLATCSKPIADSAHCEQITQNIIDSKFAWFPR